MRRARRPPTTRTAEVLHLWAVPTVQAPTRRAEGPPELRLRAAGLRDRVGTLHRGTVDGRGPEVGQIEAIATLLSDLQLAITGALRDERRLEHLVELRGARRSTADALMLTLELLDRVR